VRLTVIIRNACRRYGPPPRGYVLGGFWQKIDRGISDRKHDRFFIEHQACLATAQPPLTGKATEPMVYAFFGEIASAGDMACARNIAY